MPIAVSAAGIESDSAWAAEVSKSSGGSFSLPVWPEGSIDPNSLTHSTTNPISSHSTPNFAAPRDMSVINDKFNFDFKTDLEADIKKFMPPNTQQQKLFDNTTLLNGTAPAKKLVPFLGLMVTKSLD